jgi:hypothetical protein
VIERQRPIGREHILLEVPSVRLLA